MKNEGAKKHSDMGNFNEGPENFIVAYAAISFPRLINKSAQAYLPCERYSTPPFFELITILKTPPYLFFLRLKFPQIIQ